MWVSDAIDAMYQHALEAGVPVDVFWGLSFIEVQDLIEAHMQRQKKEFKDSVKMQFLQAGLILRFLAREKDDPIPQPWDYYPELFKADREAHEREAAAEEFERFKERRRQYADALNKHRRGL